MAIFEKINIIGEGNVSWHLCRAFVINKSAPEIHVYSRSQRNKDWFASLGPEVCLHDFTEIEAIDDLVILAVADDAIGKVAGLLSPECAVVHAAGSVSIEIFRNLGFTTFGSFYPLQTFTLGKELEWTNLPVFVGGNSIEFQFKLKTLAETISSRVLQISDSQREALHIAAVFANNFSNYLFTISEHILAERQLSFNLLLPLIQETVNKLTMLSPEEAQTGPAKRKDHVTIQKHLTYLSERPDYLEIYKVLSEGLEKRYASNQE